MNRFVIPVLALTAMVFVACAHTPVKNPDPNHTHADFAVWINGVQMDFSADKYMSAPPVKTSFISGIPVAEAHGDEDEGAALPGRDYLHLHDGNGHVIHRHKPGLTIFDFFHSLGMTTRVKKSDQDYFCINFSQLPQETCESPWHSFMVYTNDPAEGGARFLKDDYLFNDGDQILIIVDDASSSDYISKAHEAWTHMTDDACKYSKTCPWRGKPPTENCIADPNVPCVLD